VPQAFTLTQQQRTQFLAEGLTIAPGVIPRADVDAMVDRLWSALDRQHSVARDRPDTWTKAGCAQFGDLARTGAFAAMMSAGMAGLLDDFFGERGWDHRLPLPPAPLMVTFPVAGAVWNIPFRSWHLDLGRASEALRQAGKPWPDYVRIFAFLSHVEPGGGGTVYVAGSHRAAIAIMQEMGRKGGEVRSASVVKRLRAESPWLDQLYAPGGADERRTRFMETGAELRGIPLRVGEVTGQPGDVVLWHPALLHAMPSNFRPSPRLMLTATVFAKD
jgi:hypothetical protein